MASNFIFDEFLKRHTVNVVFFNSCVRGLRPWCFNYS